MKELIVGILVAIIWVTIAEFWSFNGALFGALGLIYAEIALKE